MKANLYTKTIYLEEGKEHSFPMAETSDGEHYPVFTPVPGKDMIGVQDGRVLNIRGTATFVLTSQDHFLARLYDTRKFVP
jgi:hypothetical protein